MRTHEQTEARLREFIKLATRETYSFRKMIEQYPGGKERDYLIAATDLHDCVLILEATRVMLPASHPLTRDLARLYGQCAARFEKMLNADEGGAS